MGGSGGGGPLGVKSTSEDIGGWYARAEAKRFWKMISIQKQSLLVKEKLFGLCP